MAELTDLIKEIKDIKASVGKLENIIEERLIGTEEPSRDELEAILKYEKLKRSRRNKNIPLEEALKSVGRKKKLHRIPRKPSP